MDIQTITDLRAQRNNIKTALQELRKKVKDSGEKYGDEQEYTVGDLLVEIDSILIDVLALTRAPRQFVQKSAYIERKQLLQSLENLHTGMTHENPNKLASAIDEIKPVLRDLSIRYTDERLEALNEHVNEIQQTSSNLSQHIATIEDHVNTSRNHMDTIEDFSRKITDRELRLENQNETTVQYQNRLEEFETEHQQHISEAKELIESAKRALEYKTAEGLSAAFTAQYIKADNGWSKFGWISGAIVSITAAVLLGIQITTEQNISVETVIGRISLLPILIGAAWFSAGQYVKQKNIAEDYAYKAVLAKSIVGFSERLSSENDDGQNHSYYVRKVLDQIHQDPLRKHAQKDSLTKRIANIVRPTDDTES